MEEGPAGMTDNNYLRTKIVVIETRIIVYLLNDDSFFIYIIRIYCPVVHASRVEYLIVLLINALPSKPISDGEYPLRWAKL